MKTKVRLLPSSCLPIPSNTTDRPPDSCPVLRSACGRLPRQFNDLEASVFEKMIVGRRRVFRHASLYRKHDEMHVLYIVRYGHFKLIGDDSLGERSVAGFPMAGDLLGLDAMATGHHQFRVVALEDSEVCEIPFCKLIAEMATEPGIQRLFLKKMSCALIEEYGRSALLSRTSLDERFAHFIVNQGLRYRRMGYSATSFRLIMARSDIGSYLGTTVESVSRLIARFNARGVVSIKGRAVDVLDPLFLHALANGGDLPYRQSDDS